MINEPPPFKGLNIRIPMLIPIMGRGFLNKGSTLGFRVSQVLIQGISSPSQT